MRHHTATHLLQAALRQVLGDHVKQSGSRVAPDRLRFDFTHFAALQPDEIRRIEEIVNDVIINNLPVEIKETDLDTALEEGVMALFGERYGERVRVVRVGNVSAELCGGTHVQRSGDIGFFKILSESSISAGVRRIEAVAGKESLRYILDQIALLESLSQQLKVPAPDLPQRIDSLQTQLKTLLKKMEQLKLETARNRLEKALQSTKNVDGIPVVVCDFEGISMKQLRDIADIARNRLKEGVAVLGSKSDGKVSFVAVVSKNLTHRIHAGKLIKHVASQAGGSGGGRPDMAQAGGTDPSRLSVALDSVFTYVKNESAGSS
jgi:alanyl-tRNA synthetase